MQILKIVCLFVIIHFLINLYVSYGLAIHCWLFTVEEWIFMFTWNLYMNVCSSSAHKCPSLFCICWDDHMVFILHFDNMLYHMIDLHILKNICIPGINHTWLWCMIHLRYCWIQLLVSLTFFCLFPPSLFHSFLLLSLWFISYGWFLVSQHLRPTGL